MQESQVSYGDYVGPLDLLIASAERDELDGYRSALVLNGLNPSEISHEEMTNHYVFHVTDPEDRQVTMLTSHANYEIRN